MREDVRPVRQDDDPGRRAARSTVTLTVKCGGANRARALATASSGRAKTVGQTGSTTATRGAYWPKHDTAPPSSATNSRPPAAAIPLKTGG